MVAAWVLGTFGCIGGKSEGAEADGRDDPEVAETVAETSVVETIEDVADAETIADAETVADAEVDITMNEVVAAETRDGDETDGGVRPQVDVSRSHWRIFDPSLVEDDASDKGTLRLFATAAPVEASCIFGGTGGNPDCKLVGFDDGGVVIGTSYYVDTSPARAGVYYAALDGLCLKGGTFTGSDCRVYTFAPHVLEVTGVAYRVDTGIQSRGVYYTNRSYACRDNIDYDPTVSYCNLTCPVLNGGLMSRVIDQSPWVDDVGVSHAGGVEQKYGRFEVKARMPKGVGALPNAWLMPNEGEWPYDGVELSLMESPADASEVYQRYHSGVCCAAGTGLEIDATGPADCATRGGVSASMTATFTTPERAEDELSKRYHVYAVEWTVEPGGTRLEYFINNPMAGSLAAGSEMQLSEGAPDKLSVLSEENFPVSPFYWILNHTSWVPPAQQATFAQQVFEIDYVRNYANVASRRLSIARTVAYSKRTSAAVATTAPLLTRARVSPRRGSASMAARSRAAAAGSGASPRVRYYRASTIGSIRIRSGPASTTCRPTVAAHTVARAQSIVTSCRCVAACSRRGSTTSSSPAPPCLGSSTIPTSPGSLHRLPSSGGFMGFASGRGPWEARGWPGGSERPHSWSLPMNANRSTLSLLATFALLAFATPASAAAPKDERGKLDKGCQAGKSADCLDLAYMWAEGDRGAEDQVKALDLFHRACDLKEARGCHEAARYYHVGVRVKGDPKRAIKLYDEACDGGYIPSCKQLSEIYKDGKLIAQDLTRVRFILAKACKLGDGASCYELGSLWQQGHGGALDLNTARENFQAGCETQDARCCLQAGTMLRDGIGGTKDAAAAKGYFDKACTYGGARFCGQESGKNDTRTTDNGQEIDNTACGGANSARCLVTGVVRYSPSGGTAKLKPSADFFKKKCDEKDSGGCYKLGLIAHGEDPTKAREIYANACKAGSNEACVNLGYMYIVGEGGIEDHDQARLLFFAACDAGDALGCLNQGIYLFTVIGVAKDDKLALAKFEQACKGTEPVGCFNAGVMYNLGIGTAKDPAKAQDLFKSACTDGVDQACRAKN